MSVVAAEAQLETTTLRLMDAPALCFAPEYVAAELLPSEGFTDVQYVKTGGGGATMEALAVGEIDIALTTAPILITRVDAGDQVVMLAGLHVGCYELFGTTRVRTIRDLKGKTVAVESFGTGSHIFLASMLAYVGLNPNKDINWVIHPFPESMRLLAEEQIDAYMGFPPEPQQLRAKQIGNVIINTALDRPWSQYFCCTVVANRDFVRKHPVATKRGVRAILKAADICALEPERAARSLVDRGFTPSYDYALQTVNDVSYGKWREYEPEDTVRFYALRLREAKLIKGSPEEIIAKGTDWRLIKELRKELKG
jgi:NitT/TauT family transport system substrate-binding protein